jgi:Sulfatase-modifying factor enzyme 1
MDGGRGRQAPLVALAAVVLGVLIAQIALAGGGVNGDGDNAASRKRDASLQRQINVLKAQLASAKTAKKKSKRGPRGPRGPAGPQGPAGGQGSQGAQGPAGSAPACQGNGAGTDGKIDTMVAAGPVCIDKYEVSVWSSPTGGTQYGVNTDDYPAACTDTGQGCDAGSAGEIYARSVPGVTPSTLITYFQAQAALANVDKRLPSNAEWQQAVAGSPDPGPDNGTTDCHTTAPGIAVATGSRSACVSHFGAFDMVGNVQEMVADWVPLGGGCPGWGGFSGDLMCLADASTTDGPGVLVRGGDFNSTTGAGPFAVRSNARPQDPSFAGFRGAR